MIKLWIFNYLLKQFLVLCMLHTENQGEDYQWSGIHVSIPDRIGLKYVQCKCVASDFTLEMYLKF